MNFNKILVVESKKKTKEHLDSSNKLRQILEEIGSNFLWIFHDSLTKEKVKGVDLIITLGGDGTFIEAANLIENSLILGINSSPKFSEGALTTLNIEEIDLLKEILNGKYEIIERQRALVKRNGIAVDEYSLNEIYVGANLQFHSSRYVLKYRGQEEEQRSSGVIISTGTGSVAWHKSAGGDAFGYDEKKLSFVVREPYIGKRLFLPTILKGEILAGEKIVFESKRNFGGILAVGFKVYDFNKGDIVEIELSKKPLKVIVKT